MPCRRPAYLNYKHFCLGLLAGLLLMPGCAPAPLSMPEAATLPDDPVALRIRDLTGARTRLVWVQDTGDATDYLAQRNALRLMGLDTDDGRGERPILEGPRNFAKPFFTADGRHIIFSDRQAQTCHIVDWEGREVHDLGPGFALTTWQDPQTGREWLYLATDKIDDRRTLPSHAAIYRVPLLLRPGPWQRLRQRIRPPAPELIWNQTKVSEDSFQISAGGRYAGSVFPWPEAGVLDLQTRRWTRLGRGCWVALSPDNRHLFWILDGPHRNLQMFDSNTGTNWMVRVNDAPGMGNYEVYHPRWSNHSRILAVTGPYKIGEGAYRLRGGGADVEIHLGRFSHDYRTVEAWARATYNNQADFFPDVWVAPTGAPADGAQPVAAAAAPAIPAWPLENTVPVYLWENADAQNEVPAPDGHYRICRPEPRRLARHGRHHEMLLAGGFFIEEQAPAIAVGGACTMEAVIHPAAPAAAPAADKALIMALETSSGLYCGLFEEAGQWFWRTGGHQAAGQLLGPAPSAPAHVALVYSNGTAQYYLNGEPVKTFDTNLPAGRDLLLLFGGRPGPPELDWTGRLEHIALYDRALDARTIGIHHRLLREAITERAAPEPISVRARLLTASAIPAPEDIAPYRRGLVANEYIVTEGVYKGRRFLGAHWVILDGRVLPDAARRPGVEYDMLVDPFEERPELRGERLTMDIDDLTLDLYFDRNL